MQVTSSAVRFDSLALITGVGGPLEAVSARPFLGPISPTDLTTFAEMDAIKATFAGSAPIVIVWSSPVIAPNRQPYQQSQSLLWICSATPATPEVIHGIFYYNGTDLIGVDVFDSPVTVDEEFDPVTWIATAP